MRYPRQISHQIISNDISLIIGGEKPGKKFLMLVKFLHKLGKFNFSALHCTASKKGTKALCFCPQVWTNTSLGRFFPQFVFQSKDLLPLVTILAGKMTMILSQKPELVKKISSTLKKNYSLDNNMLSITNKIYYTLSSKKDKISNTLVGKLPGKMTMILSQNQEVVRAKEKATKPIRWSFVALLENCFCFIIY